MALIIVVYSGQVNRDGQRVRIWLYLCFYIIHICIRLSPTINDTCIQYLHHINVPI